VDLLTEFYDALRHDDVDRAVQLCDPDVRVWLNPDVVAALPPRGHKEVANYLRGWFESWERYVPRPQEFIDAGDQVVAVVRQVGRGRLSGVEVEQRFAQLWTLRDRKIVRMEMYPNREAALEAAGSCP
jgi:uncharacterized protein